MFERASCKLQPLTQQSWNVIWHRVLHPAHLKRRKKPFTQSQISEIPPSHIVNLCPVTICDLMFYQWIIIASTHLFFGRFPEKNCNINDFSLTDEQNDGRRPNLLWLCATVSISLRLKLLLRRWGPGLRPRGVPCCLVVSRQAASDKETYAVAL